MWLLDAQTIKLAHFQDDRSLVEKYAILSHTWEDEEVVFHEIHKKAARKKKGFKKIEWTCQQALRDGLKYAWVDTCCINKDSSAELSEAINSMWRWYWNSKICYAYLSDMKGSLKFEWEDERLQIARPCGWEHCRWFTRGWTLQELIAPPSVQFFNDEWKLLGDRPDLQEYLAEHTKIARHVLRARANVFQECVAARLSWAAQRTTTRKEDEAYSLLGLMDVNMPLLYGEGAKAFMRLQEEIIHNHEDRSILAWSAWEPQHSGMLLAPHPSGFRYCNNIVDNSIIDHEPSYETTGKSLRGIFHILEGPDKSLFLDLGGEYRHQGANLIVRVRDSSDLRSADLLDEDLYRRGMEVVRPLHTYDILSLEEIRGLKLKELSLLRHSRTMQILLECPESLMISSLYPHFSWKAKDTNYCLLHAFDKEASHDFHATITITDSTSGQQRELDVSLSNRDSTRWDLPNISWRNERSRNYRALDNVRTSSDRRQTTYDLGSCQLHAHTIPFTDQDLGYQAKFNRGYIIRFSKEGEYSQEEYERMIARLEEELAAQIAFEHESMRFWPENVEGDLSVQTM